MLKVQLALLLWIALCMQSCFLGRLAGTDTGGGGTEGVAVTLSDSMVQGAVYRTWTQDQNGNFIPQSDYIAVPQQFKLQEGYALEIKNEHNRKIFFANTQELSTISELRLDTLPWDSLVSRKITVPLGDSVSLSGTPYVNTVQNGIVELHNVPSGRQAAQIIENHKDTTLQFALKDVAEQQILLPATTSGALSSYDPTFLWIADTVVPDSSRMTFGAPIAPISDRGWKLDTNSYINVQHGLSVDYNDTLVTRYAVVMDIRLEQTNWWIPLFTPSLGSHFNFFSLQADNHIVDVYYQNKSPLTLKRDQWTRLVFNIDATQQQTAEIWADGVLIWSLKLMEPSLWSETVVRQGFVPLLHQNAARSYILRLFERSANSIPMLGIRSLAFYQGTLTDSQIATLGPAAP
jgi:hypothetical protein